jgi:hypothetical protein
MRNQFALRNVVYSPMSPFLKKSFATGVLAVIIACGTSDSRGSDSVNVSPERANMAEPVAGISVTTDVPADVATGERIPVTIRVTNTTAAPVDLYLRGREITFDIVVTDASGAQVWQRLEDEAAQAILQLRTLGPAETIELKDEWNQRTRRGRPVGPGEYTVKGSVVTDGTNLLMSGPVRLRIVDEARGSK